MFNNISNNEVVGYIFSNMRKYENSIRRINKHCIKQQKFNKSAARWIISLAVYAAWNECQNLKKQQQIKTLEDKLNKLKDETINIKADMSNDICGFEDDTTIEGE